jgi:hypothetical protein
VGGLFNFKPNRGVAEWRQSSGNFTMGNVAALTGINDDNRFIQISAQVQPGNSRGPLLDLSGSVIGVIRSGMLRSFDPSYELCGVWTVCSKLVNRHHQVLLHRMVQDKRRAVMLGLRPFIGFLVRV